MANNTHIPHLRVHISRYTEQGDLFKLFPGIFIRTSDIPPQPWERYRLLALGLGLRPGRILGGFAAAVAWGLWLVHYSHIPVESYTRARGGRHKPLPNEKALNGALLEHHTCDVGEATATTIPRTLLDIYRYYGFLPTFVAACGAFAQGKCTPSDALQVFAEARELKLRRIKGFDSLVRQVPLCLDSALEAIFLAQVLVQGSFVVDPQAVVEVGGMRYRVDFLVRDAGLVIELDGRAKYGEKGPEQFYNLEAEKMRADALQNSAGLTVLRFGYREVMSLQALSAVMHALGCDAPLAAELKELFTPENR